LDAGEIPLFTVQKTAFISIHYTSYETGTGYRLDVPIADIEQWLERLSAARDKWLANHPDVAVEEEEVPEPV
jgi:hypothetical protein